MMFLGYWFINYMLVMFAMCVDNICWISSSPEYEEYKKKGYPIKVEGKKYYNWVSYICGYRVKSVLTDIRDIFPGIITSFILTIVGGYIW